MQINNEKIEFTDKPYEYVLKIVLLLLVLWNAYNFILSLDLKVLIPVLINGSILVLVMNRHKMAKRIVKWWALIFFILAPSLVVLSSALISFDKLASSEFLFRYATIVLGLFIFFGANRFIQMQQIDALEIEDHLVSPTNNES